MQKVSAQPSLLGRMDLAFLGALNFLTSKGTKVTQPTDFFVYSSNNMTVTWTDFLPNKPGPEQRGKDCVQITQVRWSGNRRFIWNAGILFLLLLTTYLFACFNKSK